MLLLDQWMWFNNWPRNTIADFPISFTSEGYAAVGNDYYTNSDGFMSVMSPNIQNTSSILLNCCRINEDHSGSAVWGQFIIIGK